MDTTEPLLFHALKPGAPVPDDWYHGSTPQNISVGENSVIDSAFCFKHFFSKLPVGMRVGNNVTFWRTSLATEENGLIEVGDFCYITNASIVCSERITIGARVFIGGGVTIVDSDFHPVAPAERVMDTIALSPVGNRKLRPAIKSKPVIIEDDVWIGYNAAIMKGITIGAGAIISPGSVVIDNVPTGITVSGNPAKQIM